MSMRLRKQARQLELFEFIQTNQRVWHHVPGTGTRELARIWWRTRNA